MSEKSSDSNESGRNSLFQNQTFLIAMIGVIGTIIAAVISVSPQLYQLTQKPTDTPVPTFTLTLAPTSQPTEPPTEVLPTQTATEIPPTPTETITPSPTPVDPGFACLDRWQVISGNPDLAGTDSAGNCAQASVPSLGISASNAGINFGRTNFREQGIFGIATSLPVDATVTLQIEFLVLTQGEFWIALSNTPTPENNMMILALQPNTGELRIYSDQTSRFSYASKYSELLANTSLSPNVLPYTYKIIFSISGNRVSTRIHSTNLPVQSVNLPKYLFLGYNNKSTLGTLQVQVDVSNLTVEVK